MSLKEIMSIYCENHTKHICTYIAQQNADCLNVAVSGTDISLESRD
jgi:hypothetical protein